MTKKELYQLLYLRNEIEQHQRRLYELQAKATQITQTISRMPRGSAEQQKIEKFVADINDLKVIILTKQQQCVLEQSRLEKYIADISDSLTRQIFALRFIDGLNWVQIAVNIGGNNTPDGIRMLVNRYLKKN